jgi:acetylornithine deacetylase/succinyl-diaminopimelate desuccinylase-like protein
MNYQHTTKLVEEKFESDLLTGLSDFIKIDNLSPSYDPEWNSNGKLEAAAKFCLDWVLKEGVEGLKGEIIKEDDKTPLIFIEIDARGSDRNFLLYGHFDKQPHFSGWAEGLGPTIPVIKDGWLYGRGGADDGYAIFSAVTAIKAIQKQGQPHGRVVIVIEGSEESGSPHLIHYINKLNHRIGVPDLMICLDSGAKDYETLWITTSLRGVANLDLTVEVLEEAVHSGVGTGIAPDSFMIIRNLLDRVENSETGKIVDLFHVNIPSSRIEDAKKLAAIKSESILGQVKLVPGAKPVTEDVAELILNNTWRPTLCVTGAGGLPAYSTAGNILRATTTVRLSMRIPPGLDADKALDDLENILKINAPFNCKITLSNKAAGNGWNNKDLSKKLSDSLLRTSNKLWGKDYYNFGEGGSIPFIKQLADSFKSCEILVIGVLGPNSNAHSCNEGLNIDYCKNITSTVAHTIADYSLN